ncbi:tetratricopeptide repeat protein [Tengunoibacter tsumagoiensis]|uniref:Uncharacterized protein n=1 Tax=Tengunoibacter tsumagoiensis TaxID=2014871 RepID=A0A402A411_9CHLR|nr:tetratricopeptide repeat protein [Tengunoibacter tsumagoiensis]GCE13832.1 hypothetical protein KTT_36910 [Tengunoibacter tsumagoiensis]
MNEKFVEEQRSAPFYAQERTTVDEQQSQEQKHTRLEQVRHQAHEHLAAQQWAAAQRLFQALLAEDAYDEDALLGLAAALDGGNQFEELFTIAQRVLEIDLNSALALAYKARALQKLERLSAATVANDQALLLDTNLGLAWINRSGLQLLQSKFPEALRSAERAIELAPKDARAWANYGVALRNFNRLAESLDAFDKSLSFDQRQLFSLQMKGDILCRIGRMREVLPIVQQGLEISPVDVPLLLLGVQAARSLELYETVKNLAQILLQLIPDHLGACENYVRSLRGLGEFAEANIALDRLLELDANNPRFWTLKADTLYRLERYREAVTIAERARRLDMEYQPARRIHEKALKLMYQRKEKKKSQAKQPSDETL